MILSEVGQPVFLLVPQLEHKKSIPAARTSIHIILFIKMIFICKYKL